MDTLMIVVAVLLGVLGIVGSVAPGLPGPPLIWLGLLIMYFFGGDPMTARFLFIWLAVTTIVTVLDYVLPMWFTKLTGGSKYAGWGALIGLFVGIFLTPVGMILGSLAGAFIAELIVADKDATSSLKSAFGAFLGFISTTGLKLIAAGVMMYYIIIYI